MTPRHKAVGLVVLAACVPLLAVRGVFSSNEIFYLRDLSFYFWPEHLWLRSALLAGEFPLWDSYIGFGQPSAADPIRQQFFIPTLVLRYLPAVTGFNLSVALPFPLAALGMFAMLRRHASPQASALGAILFAVSGPVLSTGNFPNLSWSVALVPFVLAATGSLATRPSAWKVLLLSSLFALLYTAGEAVVLIAGALLALAYSFVIGEATGWARIRAPLLTVVAGAGGLGLAAPQALLSMEAIGRSARAGGVDPTITSLWSFHPLGLLELAAPFTFGDYVREGAASPWFGPMNDGLIPFLFSTYVGVAVLALATAGIVGGRRALVALWTLVFAASLTLAFGHHTPLYPLLQSSSATLASLRFPAKFLVLAVLALAVLVALGWDSIFAAGDTKARRAGVWVSAAFGACGGVVLVIALVGGSSFMSSWMASLVGVTDLEAASAFLGDRLASSALRLLLVACGIGALMWAAASAIPERRPLLAALLFAMAVADPLLTNASLNPTLPAELLDEPAWASTVRDRGRVYVGGRLTSTRHRSDSDNVDLGRRAGPIISPPAVTAMDAVFLATFPSAWRVNDSVSFDLAAVWSREYTALQKTMREQPTEARVRFLRAAGVRYYLLSRSPSPGMSAIVEFPNMAGVKLFEDPVALLRARVVPTVAVEPDFEQQLSKVYVNDSTETVTVDRIPPAPAATAGPPVPQSGVLVEDGADRVTVTACVPTGGGYLFVADSYDPNWVVHVNGHEGQLLRANGLFRAVRLSEGVHEIRFSYEPYALRVGFWILAVTGATLLLGCAGAKRARRPSA